MLIHSAVIHHICVSLLNTVNCFPVFSVWRYQNVIYFSCICIPIYNNSSYCICLSQINGKPLVCTLIRCKWCFCISVYCIFSLNIIICTFHYISVFILHPPLISYSWTCNCLIKSKVFAIIWRTFSCAVSSINLKFIHWTSIGFHGSFIYYHSYISCLLLFCWKLIKGNCVFILVCAFFSCLLNCCSFLRKFPFYCSFS